jgi:hypothetical protein
MMLPLPNEKTSQCGVFFFGDAPWAILRFTDHLSAKFFPFFNRDIPAVLKKSARRPLGSI